MSDINLDKERELFEEWWESTGNKGWISYTSGMSNILTINHKEIAWCVWQARASIAPEWISVESGNMPENESWVMIKTASELTGDIIATMAFYEVDEEANETYWLAHHEDVSGWEDVTHWQPLPQVKGE